MSLLSPNLQAFFEVAQTKTVHAAAKRIRLTQTGVTQRIRALESQLGVSLFTRSRSGMRLTHEGTALLKYCQSAQEIEREALGTIEESGIAKEVQVKIAGPTSMMRARLVSSFSKALSEFKELLLDLEISDEANLLERLKMGAIHMAVIPKDQVPNELESKLLKPERYLLVGSRKWQGRSTIEIVKNERIIDFNTEDKTTFSYLKHYNLLKHARHGRLFVNNNELLCDLITQGLGYGVLTEEFASPWLSSNRLVALNSGKAYPNSLALVWYPRNKMPKYLRRLIELAR